MKTYLVTGGAGFIGSNFVLYLLRTHEDVRVVNYDALTYAGNLENLAQVADDERYAFVRADVRDADVAARVIAQEQPDYIVNFAAESHVDRSIFDPGAFESTNVTGTLTMLEAARRAWDDGKGGFGDHRFLQVSTDEVYGSLPLDNPEALFRETTPLAPRSPYSASKASADLFCRAYSETYRMPVTVTRCSNNYGPRQFPEKLIPLVVNNALNHKPIPVYGDGLNVRDWLFVDDHCRAIDLALQAGCPGQVYNVGGRNERSNIYIVRTVIGLVARATGDDQVNEGLIQHVEDRKGHDRRYGIDPSRAKRDLGWEPETAFEDGIAQTVQWYLDNPDWVRNVTSGAYRAYYERAYGHRAVLE